MHASRSPLPSSPLSGSAPFVPRSLARGVRVGRSARGVRLTGGIAAVFCVALALALVAPRLLGYTPFAVLSGSMEPAHPVGSLIYVQPVEASSLRVGDAVTFVANDQGTVATHRVIDVDGDSALLRTQGDANVAPDGDPVPFANVIGRPIACIPGAGYVVSWMTRPPGSLVIAAAAAALAVWAFVPLRRRGSKGAGRASPGGRVRRGTGKKRSETKGTRT